MIERCFNGLKQVRAIATRFDKLAAYCTTGLRLASLILWLYSRVPATITVIHFIPSGRAIRVTTSRSTALPGSQNWQTRCSSIGEPSRAKIFRNQSFASQNPKELRGKSVSH